MNDKGLGSILRQGDPAGTDALTQEEIRAMRRTVLTAVPDRRRSLLPVLALAGATVVAVLIAALALKPEPVKGPAPSRIAAVPVPSASPEPTVVQPPLPQLGPSSHDETKTTRPAHRRRPLRTDPVTVDRVAVLESTGKPAAEPGTRQIQFSTSGGTRIIWILKPGPTSR